MIEELQQAQARLNTYNARYPGLTPYMLLRLSADHPTAHVADDNGHITMCGTRLHRGFTASAEEARRLCDRCRHIIQRRLN